MKFGSEHPGRGRVAFDPLETGGVDQAVTLGQVARIDARDVRVVDARAWCIQEQPQRRYQYGAEPQREPAVPQEAPLGVRGGILGRGHGIRVNCRAAVWPDSVPSG